MDERTTTYAGVVARTVLATSHGSTCERLDGVADVVPTTVGLLSAGTQPYLVPSDPDRFFAPGTPLSCRVAIPGVGVVRCTGTTGAMVLAVDAPGLVGTLEAHRGCIAGPVDARLLRVVPLRLDALVVGLPDAGSVPVTPADLADARPDWLLARGPRLAEHLERDHADDLSLLAAAHGVPRPSSVSVTGLTTRGARLVCLAADGVTAVDVVFDPPVRNPAELWRRLSSAPASRVR